MAFLGESSQLTIGTSNLNESTEFYFKLGFRLVTSGYTPNNWSKLSDDSLLIFLNENGSHYLGFTYFISNWDDALKKLKLMNINFAQDLPREKVFFTPQDLLITLVKSDVSESRKKNLSNYITLGEAAFKNKDLLPNPILGAFGELACPTNKLEKDIEFYTQIGFNVLSKSESPYPWCILYDGINTIGLHQTKDFYDNSITYFAPDVKEQVKHLQASGVNSITEFTGTGGDENNVCIKTAEDQTVFFFKP